MTRSKLYTLLAIACLAGYIWLGYNLTNAISQNNFGVCIIKESTGYPCPSCGSTRSVVSLINGNLRDALYWNPIGLILVVILVVTPFWLGFDLVLKKQSVLNFYDRIEHVFQQRKYAIPAIILVLLNWIWNFYKGL